MKKRLGIVLCLAVVIGGVLLAAAAARDEASQPTTVGIDVTVWQRVRDGAVFVSTRPQGAGWKTHQTPIDLSALSGSGAFYQGSPVSITVALGGGATAQVDVTVWRRIRDGALFVSTRPQGAGWKTHQTPIDMSTLSSSGAFYQGSPVSIDVTLAVKRPPASDRDVLVALYHATDGPNWRDNTNWLSNRPLSHWHGVSTDSAGRVIYLSLPDNQLSGPIPGELGELSNLKWLMLNGNQLSGTIPPQLGNLANLEILYLFRNLLSGTIPRELGNLANLQQLVLWLNQLMGCVPEALQYVSDYCGFPLPHAGDRAALVALYHATDGPNWHANAGWLSDRPLQKWYGVHTDDDGRVIRLELERNQLNGELPPELGNLSRLTELQLQKNQLRGEIPRELGDLSNLKLLGLHSNQLSGTIPGELSNLSRLTWLGLQNNKLTGCVPPALRLPSRGYCVGPPLHAADRAALVALYHATDGPNWRDNTNWLSDSPEWYGVNTDHAGRVQRLDLRENQLRGELPPELGALTRLDSLDFDHNVALNGPLPESLAGIASLREVTLNGTGLCAPADDGFQRWLLNLRSWSGAICPSASPTQTTGGAVVRDIFGRAVNETGIVLVDWEGYIANPAMRYFIELPGDVPRPARVALSANESRMYFGLPSSIGRYGPAKVVEFADAFSDGGFYVSIFPDRDTSDEEHSLTIRYLDSQGRVNVQTIDVRVIDQDSDRPLDFNIILDFSNDRIGMYDREFREVIQQAADDFAYFIGDMDLDEIPAGEARIWIWNPGGYDTGRTVTNSFAYTGTLVQVYDQQHPGITPSGGTGRTESLVQRSRVPREGLGRPPLRPTRRLQATWVHSLVP